jgi:hypothetical protein
MGGNLMDTTGGGRRREEGTRGIGGGMMEEGTGMGTGTGGVGLQDQGMVSNLQSINRHLTPSGMDGDQTSAAGSSQSGDRQRTEGGVEVAEPGVGEGAGGRLRFNRGRTSSPSQPVAITTGLERTRRARIRSRKPHKPKKEARLGSMEREEGWTSYVGQMVRSTG